MSEPNSIMNIGDLAKPVTTLIEKIADATGAIFLPYQIKRVAKAEAEAAKIKALTEMEIAEITEIQRRALAWALGEQTKFQENRESVLLGAIPEIKEDAKPEEIDNDWLANFFDKCKLISDEEMQSLWSKILAGEANKSGSFSKRTIEIVFTFEKNDARLFTNLCGFVWNFITDKELFDIPIIYNCSPNPSDSIYSKSGVTFAKLTHLSTIGLINFDSGGFSVSNLPRFIKSSYFDHQIDLEFKKDKNNEMNTGMVMLTTSGSELAEICGSQKVNGFLEYIVDKWNGGYKYSNNSPQATVNK